MVFECRGSFREVVASAVEVLVVEVRVMLCCILEDRGGHWSAAPARTAEEFVRMSVVLDVWRLQP